MSSYRDTKACPGNGGCLEMSSRGTQGGSGGKSFRPQDVAGAGGGASTPASSNLLFVRKGAR